MSRERKYVNKSHYPDFVIENFARAVYPDIMEARLGEEGKKFREELSKENKTA